MIPLDDFWDFIWLRPGVRAAAGEWRACLGVEAWPAFRELLLAADGKATLYQPTTSSPPLRVINGRTGCRLICEATGVSLTEEVSEEDVRSYRLDPTWLRDALAGALGITSEPGSVQEFPRAFALGEWQPISGVAVPAFAMLPPTRKLLLSEIQRLLVENASGFVMLVPQQPRLDSRTREHLARQKALVIPLRDVVAWDGGNFCATPGWESHRNAYCNRYHPDRMVPAPPPFEFRMTGDYWTVRFDGAYTTVADAKGMAYIAHLLASPRRKVFAPDLLRAVTGEAAVRGVSSAGAQTDDTTLEDVKQEFLDVQKELEEAARNDDLATQERLQSESDQLTSYLRQAKGFNGRTREASDDADKIRRAITQAIGRVIKTLDDDKMLPAAARHLDNAVKTGLFMSYEPEEDLPWCL